MNILEWFVIQLMMGGKSGSDLNLYINPELAGAGDIIDGVGTLPDGHTFSNNSSTISAYVIGENPTYNVNPEANTGRLAFRQTRSTTDDLIVGNKYLFSAEVWIDGYVDGVNSTEELRGINVNNNASLDIDRSRADVSGANQVWERVEVVFNITAESSLIYLAHGLGVINTSTLNVQTRNLSLVDLGRSTDDDFDHNDFLFGDFA